MAEHDLIGLGAIIVFGIMAQWLAWRLHLPAILLLLIAGFVAGPLTGVLHPDEVFGDLLFPLVSVSVAIILFEGGLSLKIDELKKVGTIVRNLNTIGIVITWMTSAFAAHYLCGVSFDQAFLLGAILVVSGPTVIIPLLRQVRPKRDIGAIIKWEGIVNDPIGAFLAVLVFEVLISSGMSSGTTIVVLNVVKVVVFGTLIGLAGAGIIVILLRRYLIPDFLQNSIALMVVVISYVATNTIVSEGGLLAVTIMGVALANQKFTSIKEITEFKEDLRVILISSLFIILAARLNLDDLSLAEPNNWIFVAVLILVVRPLAVAVSTLGSRLNLREKLFIGWMAPRGIVAAAVISVFALRLAERGFENSDRLVSLTFMVIIGTVAVYGLSAPFVARLLGLAKPNPQGILFAGASPGIREIAVMLKDHGYRIALVDSNWAQVIEARNRGLTAYYASILSEELMNSVDLDGIGKLLAVTPNAEVNALATLHFEDVFGRGEVYQLPPYNLSRDSDRIRMPMHLRGRFLFGRDATFKYLRDIHVKNGKLKQSELTETFGFEELLKKYENRILPLFLIKASGRLEVFTVDDPPFPRAGDTVLHFIAEENDNRS